MSPILCMCAHAVALNCAGVQRPFRGAQRTTHTFSRCVPDVAAVVASTPAATLAEGDGKGGGGRRVWRGIALLDREDRHV